MTAKKPCAFWTEALKKNKDTNWDFSKLADKQEFFLLLATLATKASVSEQEECKKCVGNPETAEETLKKIKNCIGNKMEVWVIVLISIAVVAVLSGIIAFLIWYFKHVKK